MEPPSHPPHPPTCTCLLCRQERNPAAPEPDGTPHHADQPDKPPWIRKDAKTGGIVTGFNPDGTVNVAFPGVPDIPRAKPPRARRPRWTLIPWDSIRLVLEVLERDANETLDGWQNPPSEDERRGHLDTAFQHMVAMMAGEEEDPESGLAHAAHAVASLLFVLWKDRD